MKKLITICLLIATAFTVNAQEEKQLIGSWELEKISFENKETTPDDGHQEYADLFKMAILKNGIKQGYKLTEEDKKSVNLMASGMASMDFASTINFKEKNLIEKEYMEGSFSGNYTKLSNSMKITWENEEEQAFEIVKIYATGLIIKDKDLKVIYYYSKS